VLDALSSDYVPGSLLQAAWHLRRSAGLSTSQAIALASSGPARACGLQDRGEIRRGLRGDLVRVVQVGGVPAVREVWRGGRRVA